MLLILAGVTIATLTGPNGIITRANEAKEATEQAKKDELARLQSIEDYISSVSPSTDGYNETEGVNSPKLAKGMIPIKHNGTNWVVCEETDEDWYQYDTTNKKWANVMLSDGKYKAGQVGEGQVVQEEELGSMYVWIPRYAYQITKGYQQGSAATEKEINITFLAGNTNQDKDGNSYGKATASVNTSTTKVVHPGFTLGQRELTGIWVAKFEASGTDGSGNAVGNGTSEKNEQQYEPDETTIVKSLPSKISWRYITVGDAQKRSMDITTTNKDIYGIDYASSHLMKNSEWGAVAYLSKSKYGLETIDIAVNNINLNNSTTINGISDNITISNTFPTGNTGILNMCLKAGISNIINISAADASTAKINCLLLNIPVLNIDFSLLTLKLCINSDIPIVKNAIVLATSIP